MSLEIMSVISLVWELARFNTRESWLQWFSAVWGACFAAAKRGEGLHPTFVARVIAGNILGHTLLHGAACTWNDIIDRHIDARVERTKGRPLPSGRISVPAAFLSYLFLSALTNAAFYFVLGPEAMKFALGNQALYVLYPYAKQYLTIPQLVLAPACGWPGLVGWVSLMGNADSIRQVIPLVVAVSVWSIYFDTAYGSQDAQDDKKIGVNSLAVWVGNRIHTYLAFLGTLIIGLFSYSAYHAKTSPIFWTAGIGVWAMRILGDLRIMDITDRKAGGKVFLRNISLGGYISLVAVAELVWQTVSKQ